MSPELSFTSVLRQAKAAESQAKGTITKTEAEKALNQLTEHPHADGAERARIVQSFLDGAGAKALSPKAKEAFVAFIEAQGKEAGGQKATELKLEAARTAGGATFHLDMARGHVAKLLQGAPVAKAELGEVTKALDAAQKAIGDARKSLTGILKVADHAAKLADTELGKASSEITDAKDAVKNLVATAKRGTVTKAQLEKVQDWLANPKAEIETARQGLGLNVRTTMKFPSDNEDGGFNPFGPGGIGGATTRKFPSDNEDNQGGGAGPDIATTKKAPSDAEDVGGGGPMIHPQKPGGVVTTMKAPSDNEDGNNPGVDGPMIHPRKPDPKIGSDRLDAMRTAFGAAKNIKWHNSMPLGQRFESTEMMRERHPDGYQFDVMVPVGALTPTAPRTDPNKVDSFWIRRSGGFAGLTQYAGPFTIADAGKKADLKSAVANLLEDIQKVQFRATEELRWEDAVDGITIKGNKVEVFIDDRTAFDAKGIDRAVTDELKKRGVKADVVVVAGRRGGGPSTEAVGEEGGGMATTMAVGEEGGGFGGGASTEAVGEEGGGFTTEAVGEE